MIRCNARGLALALSVALFTSCASDRKAVIASDKNTNWLARCDEATRCRAGLECLDGLCTRACEGERDCSGLAGAVCAALPGGGACSASSDAPRAICTLECSAQVPCSKGGTSCVGGACIPALCVDPGNEEGRDAAVRDAAPSDTPGPREAGNPAGDSSNAGGSREAGSDVGDAGRSAEAGSTKPDASPSTDIDAGAGPGATGTGSLQEGGAFVPRITPTGLGNQLQLRLEVTTRAADPVRDRLYAATSSQDATYPRSLVTVDSQTGVVLDALPLAEDAVTSAVSDDGATLWIGSGPTQVDLRGTSPRLGKTGSASVKRGARTLVPLRGSSTAVAAIDSGDQVVVLDELVARPNTFGDRTILDQIALGPDGHLFVTDYYGSLHHLVFDADGVRAGALTMPVTTTAAPTGAAPGDLVLGYLNEVWDVSSPESPRLSGRLPDINRDAYSGTAFLSDTRTAWALSSESFGGSPELRVIDLATLTPQGRVALGSEIGFGTVSPVKTHAGGLAFGAMVGSGRALLILPRLPTVEVIQDSRNSQAHGDLLELPLAAEHLVADPARHRLYATICGDADRAPNQLVTIDSAAGTVLNSVWVGSNPTALALSDDGSTLWVSLEGSSEIRRVDLSTQFPTPRERYSLFAQTGGRTQAEALFALPGGAGTIAAQLYTPTVTGDTGRVLVVADDGQLRPKRFPAFTPSENYQFVGGPAGYVYGLNYSSGLGSLGFYSIAITTEGPVGGSPSVLVNTSGGLTYDPAGFVYASSSLIDVQVPGAPALVGQLLGGLRAPKPDTDVVFGLSTRDVDDPLVLTRGKRSTLTEEGRATLGAEGDTFAYARDLVYIQTDRVAFIAKAADFTPARTRKRSSIWFSAVPPAATVAAVNPSPDGNLLVLPLAVSDLVADPKRNRIYATGIEAPYENQLVTIDAKTAKITDSLLIGSRPTALAISDDASTLWVSLQGSGAIRSVDLTATPPTPADARSLPIADVATSLVVLPGARKTVAASLHLATSAVSPNEVGVFVLDDGQARPDGTPSNGDFMSEVIAGPPGYVFAHDTVSSAGSFFTLAITASGFTYVNHGGLASGAGFVYDPDGYVYSGSGDVIDVRNPTQPKRAGTFPVTGAVLPIGGSPTTLMLSAGAGNVVSGVVLHRLDTGSFAEVNATPLGTRADVILVTSAVRVNPGTLAFAEWGANVSFRRICILNDAALVP